MNRDRVNTTTKFGDYEEVTTNTPGFFAKLKRGDPLPSNPYYWNRVDMDAPSHFVPGLGTISERMARGTQRPYSAFIGGYADTQTGGSTPCPTLQPILDDLGNKLRSKVSGQDINLGVALGEYRETANMISSSMVKVARAIRAARKGNVAGAVRAITGSSKKSSLKDVAKSASDAWLSVTYGLKPLLNDIYGACKVLEESYGKSTHVPVKRVRASQKFDWKGTVTDGSGASVRYSNDIGWSGKASGTIYYYVDNPLLFTMDQLGLTNPALIAWELVPYSFVVDWFIPVGDFLLGVVPPQGVTFTSGYYGFNFSGWNTSETYVDYYPSPYIWQTRGEMTQTVKRRYLLNGFPTPSLRVPDISLSKERVMSGLSLIVQAVHGGRGAR